LFDQEDVIQRNNNPTSLFFLILKKKKTLQSYYKSKNRNFLTDFRFKHINGRVTGKSRE